MEKYSSHSGVYKNDCGDYYLASEVDAVMNRLTFTHNCDVTKAEEYLEEAKKQIVALQLYKDATLGKESERERQIDLYLRTNKNHLKTIKTLGEQFSALKAEIADIEGKLRGEQIRNRDIGEQMDTLTADNEQLKKEAVELHDKYGKLWDENSVLRKQNSAMKDERHEVLKHPSTIRDVYQKFYDEIDRQEQKIIRQAEEIVELKTPCYCCREFGCQDGCKCNQDALKEPEVEDECTGFVTILNVWHINIG
jgi:chromosome segregation ATPase